MISEPSSSSALPPGLAAVLEAFTTAPPSADVTSSMQARALELLTLAAADASSAPAGSAARPPTFVSGDGRIFKMVFAMLFDEAEARRAGAAAFFAWTGDNTPMDFDMTKLLPKLGSGGEYHQFMLNGVKSGNGPTSKDSMAAWAVSLRLLGDRIRQSTGTQLLNDLLSVAEKGFKSDVMPLRADTYRNWCALIDNFCQDEIVLAQPKRINLLVRPLASASGTSAEIVVRAKFETYWYLIRRLQSSASKHMESVILPFLELCYGFVKPSPTYLSPVKRYGDDLSAMSLDAFSQLLGSAPIGSNSLPALNLGAPIFNTNHFLEHAEVLTNSMEEAFINMNFANNTDIKRFEAVFSALAGFVHNLESSKDPLNIRAVLVFLANVNYMVEKSKRSAPNRATIIFMMEEVRKMPSSLLCSTQPELKGNRPIITMVNIVLNPDLVVNFCCSNERMKASALTTLNAFLKKGTSSKSYGLEFLGYVMGKLEDTMEAPSARKLGAELAATLWKSIAASLKDYVSCHHEVNELGSAVKHSTAAVTSVLIFAVRWLASSAEHGAIWNQWIELYSLVSNAAAVMITFSPLEMDAEVAKAVVVALARPDVTVHSLSAAARILRHALLPNVPFKDLAAYEDGSKVLKRLVAILGIVGDLAKLIPAHKEKVEIAAEAGTNLCEATKELLQKAPTELASQMVPLLPQLSRFMMVDLQRSLGSTFEEASDAMTNAAMTMVQTRCGKFDEELLATLQPFLVAVLGHGKRSIKASAKQMWSHTFGPAIDSKKVPAQVASLLRRTLLLGSPSSTSSSQVSSIEESQDSPAPIPLTPSFGSFLNRTTPTKTSSATSKTSSSTPSSTSSSPLKSFKKSPGVSTPSPYKSFKKPQSSKRALEDESSQDFVPIKSAEKKRRVLTEHQREKMTSRSDDIPALYSELSRDESVVGLPAQFQSQHSMDESSQMAMDAFSTAAQRETEEEEPVSQSLLAECSPSDSPSLASHAAEAKDTAEEASSGQSSSIPFSPSESSKRRKGRPPVKNLPPVTKRLSEGDLPMGGPVKRGRGRPRKVDPLSSGALSTPSPSPSPSRSASCSSLATAASESTTASESTIARVSNMTKDVTKPVVVVLPRMSQENCQQAERSPVKVVNLDPLVLEPVAGRSQEACAAKKGLRFGADDDVDVIESSQKDVADDAPLAARKRFRRSASLTNTSLAVAVRGGDLARARSQLASGNCDAQTKDAALHAAMQDAPHAEEMIRLLIDNGADINNAQAGDGNTPLHDAVRYLPEKLIRVLLSRGADASIKNRQGQTPLDLAPEALKTFLEGLPSASKSPAGGKLQNLMRDLAQEMEKSDSNKLDESVANKGNSERPQPTQVPESMDIGAVHVLSDRANCPSPAEAASFTKLADKPTPSPAASRKGPVFLSSRGAKMLNLAKTKGPLTVDTEDSQAHSSGACASATLSPLAAADPLLTTPTSTRKAWERFLPSPSTASPSAGILKRKAEDSRSPAARAEPDSAKRRRVQFTDPAVSDSVEIPRLQDLMAGSKPRKLPLAKPLPKEAESPRSGSSHNVNLPPQSSSQQSDRDSSSSQENDSNGLYVGTPPVSVSSEMLCRDLKDCNDPVSAVLAELVPPTRKGRTEKQLCDLGITKVCHLATMTTMGAGSIMKVLHVDNIERIKTALAKLKEKLGESATSSEKPVMEPSPVMEVNTPEDDDLTMREMYEHRSPVPSPRGVVSSSMELGEDDGDKNEDDGDKNEDEMPAILQSYRSSTEKEKEKKSPAKTGNVPSSPSSTSSSMVLPPPPPLVTSSAASVQASPESGSAVTRTDERDSQAVLSDVLRDLDLLPAHMRAEVAMHLAMLNVSDFEDA